MFQPVQVEEMAFAMALFVSAASGQLSSGRKPLTVKNREEGVRIFASLSGEVTAARSNEELRDTLDSDLFRAFMIVWEHYRNDTAQASIAARLLGFYRLMVRSRGKALEAWVASSPSTDETVELHPRVIETIASVGLTRDGRFDETKFLNELNSTPLTPRIKAEQPGNAWPAGSDRMAKLVREFPWAGTPLGPVTDWPQSLRTAVDLALACRFPMVILWGEDLVQIYNEGYCDLMGSKHPEGLGQPTRECWPEVWHINQPIYARVRAGETVTIDDGLYPIQRRGAVEDAYFTLCYSALRDESAGIAGILVTVFETTERVQAELRSGARDKP